MSRRAPWLAVSIVWLLATACRAPVGPVGPSVALAPDDPRPRALLAELARFAAARQSLRGVARISLDGPAGSGRAKQVVVAARPARLRVEVLGFLNQTAAVLVTDGKRFQLLQASDRSVAEGEVTPELLAQVAGIALSPEEAVDVLLGAPTVPAGLVPRGGLLRSDGAVRVVLGGGDGRERWSLDFDAAGQLRRLAVVRDGGRSWAASFGEYALVGGEPFPHRIELRFEATGTEARLDFSRVELNPPLPAGIFALPRAAANEPRRRGGA